jgi:hypothetical protein
VKVKKEVQKMTTVAEVDNVDDAAQYIGNYLNTQSYRVRKYIMSAGWVFPGWIGFSQWFKKEFGIYPPREMLVELAKMSKGERQESPLFGLFLWEKEHSRGEWVTILNE